MPLDFDEREARDYRRIPLKEEYRLTSECVEKADERFYQGLQLHKRR